jgi:hypothetical protein
MTVTHHADETRDGQARHTEDSRRTRPWPSPAPGYREVLGDREFRALLGADLGSLLGDQVAAVAVSVLLFQRTGSALVAAGGYALGWLPALVGGPVLAALADRMPSRRLLVGADLTRAALIAAVARPGTPIPVLAAAVLAVATIGVPHQAAVSALQVQVLTGPRFVLGMSLRNAVHQGSQLAGFAAGGAVVLLLHPAGALLADAGTFLFSALLLRFGLQRRPAAQAESDRNSLLDDTLEGLRLVAADRALRRPLLLGVVGVGVAVVPEALAPAYAARLGAGAGAVGLIMASTAAGSVLGGLLLTRLAPAGGLRLAWSLALVSTVPLIGVATGPGLTVSLLLFSLTGAAGAFQLCANAAFAAAAPAHARARVFGVAAAGIGSAQAVAVIGAGALAELTRPAWVIAAIAAAGAVLLLCLAPAGPQTRGTAARHRA